MKILFLDQSGEVGGAELCLLDTAEPYKEASLVCLLSKGPFKDYLTQKKLPVCIFDGLIPGQKESEFSLQLGLAALHRLLPLIVQIAKLSHNYEVIYANTPKSLLVGALASLLSQRPLVYHLHDIVSPEHFSATNRRLIVMLANGTARQVIANSNATQAAFVAAGGNPALTTVIYNGFDLQRFQNLAVTGQHLRQQWAIADRFVIGHFSRLAPWKGQHVLLETLAQCPKQVVAMIVGDGLFGQQAYAHYLRQRVVELGLGDRVRFLGFRTDVPALMAACDLVVHTSVAPEPFGRVIVEAMLCGTPVIASQTGGTIELIDHNHTGWLVPPGDSEKLARMIHWIMDHPEMKQRIVPNAQAQARQRFDLVRINQQLAQVLQDVIPRCVEA
jgi:glycosyltransferase involved in cell wall biosynthesis